MIKNYIIALIFFTVSASYAQTSTLIGKVVSIADGDTFTLLIDGNKQQRIRLYGIDCPEKHQDYGQVAKKITSSHLFWRTVTVKPTGIDKYGRIIAMVYLPDRRNLNELLLNKGLAWHYFHYDNNQQWINLEKQARDNKVGLWQHSEQIAPWNFRKNRHISFSSKSRY